ncbi:MAG: trehalose-6-phosphate synthase [Acidobacteriota bacterium]
MTLVSLAFTYFDVLSHRHVLRQELDNRTKWMGLTIVSDVEASLQSGNSSALSGLTRDLRRDTGALGLAIYDAQGHLLASSGPSRVMHALYLDPIKRTVQQDDEQTQFGKTGHWRWLEHTFPLHDGTRVAGTMALVADASYITADAGAVWRRSFWLVVACVILITAITGGMLTWFLTRPMSRIAERLRHVRTGHDKAVGPIGEDMELISPIAREVENIAQSLKAARAAAITEARLRQSGDQWWTAEKLAVHIRSHAKARRIFVVSNREPYMHVRHGQDIDWVVPPSGLVTALEPVLRASDGVWVANGCGEADALTVDEFDHLRVPPEDPKYTLRRVWTTEEEEQRFYDGFANEGLWPLCHVAHTRPIFRAADWKCYQEINERFARALLAEMKDCPEPIVLAQDYHFALLPRMVKRVRPDARVALFWHIPWPNPEAFGICPWQTELLEGLLGADLLGFHIPLHCHNFLATVDHVLEARTSHDQLTTRHHGHLTSVRPYPISVACEDAIREQEERRDALTHEAALTAERDTLLAPFGTHADAIALGVDRLDYTKGIVERLIAFEHLLEERPWYQGRLTLVQIAAPSRTRIHSYANLRVRVEELVEQINNRFLTSDWKPVVLIEDQLSHEELRRWYNVADLCMVTSLHDGMNLVSKEYVAARSDEDGVLILSKFTGAALELQDALIVNPYDTDAVAEAMHRGLQMGRHERRDRMRRMRRQVMEHNVYLWAASILGDLRDLRLEHEEGLSIARVTRTVLGTSDLLQKKTA